MPGAYPARWAVPGCQLSPSGGCPLVLGLPEVRPGVLRRYCRSRTAPRCLPGYRRRHRDSSFRPSVDTCHFPERRHDGTLNPPNPLDKDVPIDKERRVTSGRFSVTLMMGAPGAGKGTQAVHACEVLGVPHVATGDLLRDHQRHGTELGTKARVYMDRGDLVPDDLVMGMLIERLQRPDAANGTLLDGFPRTLSQARALDDGLGAYGGGV